MFKRYNKLFIVLFTVICLLLQHLLDPHQHRQQAATLTVIVALAITTTTTETIKVTTMLKKVIHLLMGFVVNTTHLMVVKTQIVAFHTTVENANNQVTANHAVQQSSKSQKYQSNTIDNKS